jgi:uncharacterized protein (TIGR02246 family)
VEQSGPADIVRKLVESINRGDVENALKCYEQDAVLLAQPGQVTKGRQALRSAIEGFIALKPELRGQAEQVVQAGDLALYCSKWTLAGTGPDGKPIEMSGASSDVLRRQADGRWLVVVDNPWGTGILG